VRILNVGSTDSKSSFMDCIAGIDAKQRDKLSRKLALLKMGNSVISPDIKHFSISKYSRLYELQMKGQIRLRVIFTLTKAHGGDVILLVPFIKRHKRHTMQALESALKILGDIDSGELQIQEVNLDTFMKN